VLDDTTPTQFGVNDPPDRSGSAGGGTDPELLKRRGLREQKAMMFFKLVQYQIFLNL